MVDDAHLKSLTLRQAAENFVRKVESGRARSVESYSEFKAALDNDRCEPLFTPQEREALDDGNAVSNSAKLKPCPFCLKEINVRPGVDAKYFTMCSDEECAGSKVWDSRTTHDCPIPVSMWNRRTTPRFKTEDSS